jgi:hypothetical protein
MKSPNSILAIDMVVVFDILRYCLWADCVLSTLQMYTDFLQLNQNNLCQMDSDTSFSLLQEQG